MTANRAGVALLLAGVLVTGTHGADDALRLPLGLAGLTPFLPADNPLTPERIALGKQIFWDKRASIDGSVACVNCHLPEHGWADPRPFSVHAGGRTGRRHSPTLVNRLFSERQGWAGSFESLEDFGRGARDVNESFRQLTAIPGYREAFRQVFASEVTADAVAQAVAAYMRTILSGNSPHDRFQAGDRGALSALAQRGLSVFEGKARCTRCHAGPNLTDEGYHNLGVGMDRETPDLGRYLVSRREVNKGAFKTPTLRDVARRPPYMHDGSLKSLREVVLFYNRGGQPNSWLAPEITALALTGDEQEALVALLEALTGEVAAEVSTPPVLPQ